MKQFQIKIHKVILMDKLCMFTVEIGEIKYHVWFIMAYWHQMLSKILVNIGSGHDFLTSLQNKYQTGQQTLTGKIWVGLVSFPSLSYINFGKIVLQSSKFQILFWRLFVWWHQAIT